MSEIFRDISERMIREDIVRVTLLFVAPVVLAILVFFISSYLPGRELTPTHEEVLEQLYPALAAFCEETVGTGYFELVFADPVELIELVQDTDFAENLRVLPLPNQTRYFVAGEFARDQYLGDLDGYMTISGGSNLNLDSLVPEMKIDNPSELVISNLAALLSCGESVYTNHSLFEG